MQYPVDIRGLTVAFKTHGGTVCALDNLNLKIPTGAVFGFLGPNGAGKTTTMHVLLGFVRPTAGDALLFGQNVSQSIARQRIGYLPEHPDTYRFLTGRELLHMAGKLFGIRKRELRSRVDNLLSLTDMSDAADRRIGTYSRGMLQRICIAQALINDPDLVILDEPTGGLDPIGRMAVRNIIDMLRRKNKTVFFSSHELSEVELTCDEVAILSNGRVATRGKTQELVPEGESLERFFMNTIAESTDTPRKQT